MDNDLNNMGRDHPRMCGEHLPPCTFALTSRGSSPHVRGALDAIGACVDIVGIIPACAGSTGRRTVENARPRDHPRMCGEHQSPVAARPDGSGIIPACAGSTPPRPTPPHTTWDHPRMCGEHPSAVCSATFSVGSSPHVRGARAYRNQDKRLSGIIPACAGSTFRRPRTKVCCRDHPRMCGEHPVQPGSLSQQAGSSPHVRGARQVARERGPERGIIPACAGSTAPS